jgi:hypothetical protein
MTEQTVNIMGSCDLVVTRYSPTLAPDVAIRYIEYSTDHHFPDRFSEADIDADTARAMIALLVEAFGSAVLSGAGGAA